MDLDRPTIAVIRGVAIGGGLGLALACDLRFCAADAHLAITPAKLGLVYGHAETRRLVELVGPSRAKDLLFTARRIETDEALAIGLIDRRRRDRIAGDRAWLRPWACGHQSNVGPRGQARDRRHRRRHEQGDAGLPRADRSRGAGAGFRRRAERVREQAGGEIRISRADRAAARKASVRPVACPSPCCSVLALVGFASGFVDAIAGGGGLLTVPALVLAGLDPVAAVATNKLAGVFGTGSATLAFARAGKIEANMVPAALAACIGGRARGAGVALRPARASEPCASVRPRRRRALFRPLP